MKKLITQDQNILGGKPIITGTRLSVEVVLELMLGMSDKEILKEYSFLNKDHLQAVRDFTAKIRKNTRIYRPDKSQIVLHEILS